MSLTSANIANQLDGGYEFVEEVMQYLKKRKVTFRGHKPCMVELVKANGLFTGRIKIWFQGQNIGEKPYLGGVGIGLINPSEQILLTDPEVVAELCDKSIKLMHAA